MHVVAAQPLRPSAQQRGPEAGGRGVGAQERACGGAVGEDEHVLVPVLREGRHHVDRHGQTVGVAHHQHQLAPVERARRHAPRHAHEERIGVRRLRLRLRLRRRGRLHARRRLPLPPAAPSPPSAGLARLPLRTAAAAAAAAAAGRVQRGRALGRRRRAAAEQLTVRALPLPLRARPPRPPRARPYEPRAGRRVEGGPPQLGHLRRHARRRATRRASAARHSSARHSPARRACGVTAARRQRRRHRGAQVGAAAGVGGCSSASGRRAVEAEQAGRLVGRERAAQARRGEGDLVHARPLEVGDELVLALRRRAHLVRGVAPRLGALRLEVAFRPALPPPPPHRVAARRHLTQLLAPLGTTLGPLNRDVSALGCEHVRHVVPLRDGAAVHGEHGDRANAVRHRAITALHCPCRRAWPLPTSGGIAALAQQEAFATGTGRVEQAPP